MSEAAPRFTTSRIHRHLASRISHGPPLTNYPLPFLPSASHPTSPCSLTHSAVNSIVLITNGLSFAFQAVFFLAVGSLADYGVWRPHITTAFTVLAWGVSFGWLGVEDASK